MYKVEVAKSALTYQGHGTERGMLVRNPDRPWLGSFSFSRNPPGGPRIPPDLDFCFVFDLMSDHPFSVTTLSDAVAS